MLLGALMDAWTNEAGSSVVSFPPTNWGSESTRFWSLSGLSYKSKVRTNTPNSPLLQSPQSKRLVPRAVGETRRREDEDRHLSLDMFQLKFSEISASTIRIKQMELQKVVE